MQTHVTVFQSCQQGRSSIRRSNIYPCTHVDSGGNFAWHVQQQLQLLYKL